MNRYNLLLVSASLMSIVLSGCGESGEGDRAADSSGAAAVGVAEAEANLNDSVAPGPTDEAAEPAAGADGAAASDTAPPAAPSAALGVADDGFPTGQSSPEGVACDMARAFINRDSALWRQSCLPASAGKAEYAAFLDEMANQMDKFSAMPPEQAQQAGGPKQIGTVYAARNLSRNGPASYGYAVMQLTDVKFVDVVAPTWEGADFMARTLVVQRERDGKWYAIPRPDLFPMLSEGLNDESDSHVEWPSSATPSPREAAGG